MMRMLQIILSCIILGCTNISGLSAPSILHRRAFLASGIAAGAVVATPLASQAEIDVNNAAAGDFQKYPGLFPTISAKIINLGPFKDAKEMYEAMDNPVIVERLKQYEKEFTFGQKNPGGDRGSGKRSV